MKKHVNILWQSSPLAPGPGVFEAWGKAFQFENLSDRRRLVVHRDFPMINSHDIDRFEKATRKARQVVVSGCRIDEDVHPYRLFRETDKGRLKFAVDIAQEIRGARQRYQTVFKYVAALICIPADLSVDALLNEADLLMYVMEPMQLLDKTDMMEWLQIELLRGKQARKLEFEEPAT